MQRLLGRAALTVNGGRRHRLGPASASTALRPTLNACSPTWDTQPMMTSSTRLDRGSCDWRWREVLLMRGPRVPVTELPVALAPGVRTASTMTAVGIAYPFVVRGKSHRANTRRELRVSSRAWSIRRRTWTVGWVTEAWRSSARLAELRCLRRRRRGPGWVSGRSFHLTSRAIPRFGSSGVHSCCSTRR